MKLASYVYLQSLRSMNEVNWGILDALVQLIGNYNVGVV